MFIRTKKSPNSPRQTVQIVESVRSGKSVKQRILQYIGVASDDEELAKLKQLARQVVENLKKERREKCPQQNLFNEPEQPEESQPYERAVDDEAIAKISDLENESTVIEGPMEVAEKIFSYMGYESIFGNAAREAGHRTLLKRLLAGVLARPSSKLSMSEWFAESCAIDVSEDRIYRFLDGLHKREDRVKEVVRYNSEGLLLSPPTLMLFDVTTIYNESIREDDLRKFGYSKDNKVNETQTVLALATTPEGLPLWYELFPGNTYEGETFHKFVDTWRREEYPGSKGVVAADSAMFQARGIASLREKNLHYVISARLKNLSRKMKEKILNSELYSELPDGEGSVRYMVLSHGDSNLVVTYSPRRAARDAKKRERLLAGLKKKLNQSGEIKSSSVKSNKGRSRYLKASDGKEASGYVLDEEKIANDAKWDGLHGVVTDLPVSGVNDIKSVLSHYRSLWRIEESFRISKSGLKIRPIYHHKEERIRAHIALIYMAFACIRHLQTRLKLTQHIDMSVEEIRKALIGVTSSLIRDKSNGVLYRFPKRISPQASRIYKSLGLKRTTRPTQITSMTQYRARRKYLRGEQSETELA
jgi:transposase